MPNLRATSSSYFAFTAEATYGTYRAPLGGSPNQWCPYKSPAPEDQFKYLDSTGLQGSMVQSYGEVQGVGAAVFQFDMDFFTDSTPGLFKAILGGSDTVASVSASVWSHTFSLLNNSASTGNQPSSYSLTDFDGFDTRGYPACILAGLDLKWQADGLITCTAKWIGNSSSVVATPSSGFSGYLPVPAWEIVTTVGGSPSSHVESGEINIARKTEQPYTGNQNQSPFQNFAGAMDVGFKLTCSAENDTEYNYFRNNTQPTLSWAITDPVNGYTFALNAGDAAFTTGKPTRQKEYLQWDVSGKLVPNTSNGTSGGGGGSSPFYVVAQNNKSTGYG